MDPAYAGSVFNWLPGSRALACLHSWPTPPALLMERR